MNILIGFEESQEITKAFRIRGHNAFSCDLKPCSGGFPEFHLQIDIYEALRLTWWDFVGLHPVCTAMTNTGNRHYGRGSAKWDQRVAAVDWTVNLYKKVTAEVEMVYMENPVGAMNGHPDLPKPQIIQPYFFGDPYQKTTCLWLHGLPPLFHAKEKDLFNDSVTHVGKGDFVTFPLGKRMPAWYSKLAGDSEKRSKTFPGIAVAMSQQWG